jgi:hypothetical protein
VFPLQSVSLTVTITCCHYRIVLRPALFAVGAGPLPQDRAAPGLPGQSAACAAA